jgi:hypothetical protein
MVWVAREAFTSDISQRCAPCRRQQTGNRDSALAGRIAASGPSQNIRIKTALKVRRIVNSSRMGRSVVPASSNDKVRDTRIVPAVSSCYHLHPRESLTCINVLLTPRLRAGAPSAISWFLLDCPSAGFDSRDWTPGQLAQGARNQGVRRVRTPRLLISDALYELVTLSGQRIESCCWRSE